MRSLAAFLLIASAAGCAHSGGSLEPPSSIPAIPVPVAVSSPGPEDSPASKVVASGTGRARSPEGLFEIWDHITTRAPGALDRESCAMECYGQGKGCKARWNRKETQCEVTSWMATGSIELRKAGAGWTVSVAGTGGNYRSCNYEGAALPDGPNRWKAPRNDQYACSVTITYDPNTDRMSSESLDSHSPETRCCPDSAGLDVENAKRAKAR